MPYPSVAPGSRPPAHGPSSSHSDGAVQPLPVPTDPPCSDSCCFRAAESRPRPYLWPGAVAAADGSDDGEALRGGGCCSRCWVSHRQRGRRCRGRARARGLTDISLPPAAELGYDTRYPGRECQKGSSWTAAGAWSPPVCDGREVTAAALCFRKESNNPFYPLFSDSDCPAAVD